MRMIFISLIMVLAGQVAGHSGGLNKQGCHAGSQPYHCHKPKSTGSKKVPDNTNIKTMSGTVTHVRDGDTIELDFDNDDDSLVESPGACVAVTGIYWQNIKVSSDASCVRISVGESDRRVEDIDARSRVSADP